MASLVYIPSPASDHTDCRCYGVSPLATRHLALVGCVPIWLGDGYCDPVNNIGECDYDGGDVRFSF